MNLRLTLLPPPLAMLSQVPYLTEVAEWGASENDVEVEERSAWHRLNKM